MMPNRVSSYPLSLERTRTSPKIGYSAEIAHHGEILQGVFEEPGGRLCRGLVTLTCEAFKSEATFFPDSSGVISVEPTWKTKALRAIELTLALCNGRACGGSLKIYSNIPLRLGFGSSTSDVIAAIRAVSETLGVQLGPELIATLAVQAETASDATMFGDQAVLFAHRNGVLMEDLGAPLPALDVLGFNTDPTGIGIDTLSFPPARYTWWEIEAFRPLVGLMRRAVHTQDPRLVGQVASASARINQRHLPKPHFDDLEKLVEAAGARGLQVAHSGTVVGLLFDPEDSDREHRIAYAQAMLAERGFHSTWRFISGKKNGVTA